MRNEGKKGSSADFGAVTYRILGDSRCLSGTDCRQCARDRLAHLFFARKDMGLELKIKVSFSMDDFDSFEALARIVWEDVHVETRWEGYKYGLELVQISQNSCQKLRELLLSQEEQRLQDVLGQVADNA